jgi:ABC-type transporter Mla subunit MlaD
MQLQMRGPALRVGAFVVVVVAGFGALLFFLSGNSIRSGRSYESYFRESVQGLDVGAPVKFRGVTLGQVTAIGLTSAEYGRGAPADIRRATLRLVYVRFVIDTNRVGRAPDDTSVTRNGLRARIAAQGLTGLSYLELDFVDPQKFPPEEVPWTPRAEVIPSMPSTLTQVQDAAQQLLAKFQQVDVAALAKAVQTLVSDLDEDLKDGDVHQALARTSELLSTVQASVKGADLPGLAGDVRRTVGAVHGVVQGPQVRELLAAATAAANRLAAASSRLGPLITALQATTLRADNSAADVQQDLAPILRDVRAAAANLRDTSDALRRYPAQVILGGPPPRDALP